jgi:hypothetical protein
MLADALVDLSNRGDIAIDPFLGSGSTLIAADKIGNVSRGVDLDSLYVEVIMRQYAAATGNPAVLIETGEAFDAPAREGQGRQRRSRAGFQTRPRHYEALETTAPSTRASACTSEVSGSNPSAPPGSPREQRWGQASGRSTGTRPTAMTRER